MISILKLFKSFKKSSAPLFLLPLFLYSIASAQTASPAPASTAIPKNVVSVISRSEMESDTVSGPGKLTSFYKNGTFYNEELEFLGEMYHSASSMSRLEFTTRLTDNILVDPERFSIEKLAYNFKDDKNDITFGDYFANFTQYSFSKAIKGAGFQHNFQDDKNYIRATYGSFYNQWDYLLHNWVSKTLRQTEPMSRYGGGARYQIGGDKYFVGFNSVFISDQENDGNRITENAYSQNLNSIDWEYVFKSLRFMGEHARSDTRTKPSSGARTRTDAWANIIKMRGDAFGFNLDARIENVAPDFSTLGGGATPDRRRYYGNISRQITKHLRGYLMSDYYYNRIDDTSTATIKTNNSTIETGLTQTNLFSRKDMTLSGIYRFGKDKNVDGTNERIKNRVKLSLSDRLFKELKYKAAVEGIFEEDVPDQTMGNNYLYSLDLSWRRKLTKDILIRPELFYSYRFTDNVTTRGDDKVNTVRFNLTGDYKGNNRFGMGAELIGSNVFQGTDSCNTSWDLYYERALKTIKDATFKIDYKVNRYDFSGDHPGDDNYTEKRFIMSFNMRI